MRPFACSTRPSVCSSRDRFNPLGASLPVTAKPSRKSYETFGDDIANELVTWFNDVDATYRTDLRELNELNFARFDAKLAQRAAQLEAQMRAGFAELRAELLRWMFIYRGGSVVTTVGLVLLVLSAVRA
jgi:hypothetical protein